MTGYLSHLAAIALGKPVIGAARPSLPPLLAPHGDGAFEAARYEESRRGPSRLADPRLPRELPAEAFLSDAGERGGSAPAEPKAVFPPAEPGALDVGPAARGTHREPVRAARVTAIAATRPRSLTSRAPASEPPLPLDPRLPQGQPLTVAGAIPGDEAGEYVPSAGPAPRSRPLATTQDWRPGPLRDVVLTARPAQPGRGEPVIHVTIDRIEVRAPAAPVAPTPAARPGRAEPSLSLSEFLRGSGARGRR